MRRHWKDTAERAAKSVNSESEVCEALTFSLKCDILETPIEEMREILDSRKPDLFPTRQVEQLEELRSTCGGSAAANVSIDCAIEAIQSGLRGHAAVQSALQNRKTTSKTLALTLLSGNGPGLINDWECGKTFGC
jgi:hypothetical protein